MSYHSTVTAAKYYVPLLQCQEVQKNESQAGRPRRKVGFSEGKGIDDPAACGVCGGRTFVIVIGERFVSEAVRP